MKAAFISIALASVGGMICYVIAGDSLNLFIGSFFFAAILAGQLSGGCWGTFFGITVGFMCCWWMPVHADRVTIREWMMCSGVLFTFVSALVMSAEMLRRFSPTGASAVVTVSALAWLSWPVWLSTAPPRGLIFFHPLFAINHIVSDLGIWTEQQGAYNMTVLGQDVAYQLPTSAWPVMGVQAAITLLFLVLTSWRPNAMRHQQAAAVILGSSQLTD